MLKLVVCIIFLAANCCNRVALSCRTTDDRQINLLRLQVDHFTQEVEALKNQSRANQQKERIYSLSQEVKALKNQSKENRQLFLDIFTKGLYVPPHVYVYQLTPNSQSWQRSQQYCLNWGGDLAVYGVQSLENRKKLIQKFSMNSIYFWIGASDIASEGKWVWVNGENASSSQLIWDTRTEPNNHGGSEDCAKVDGKPGFAVGLAYDQGCARSYRGLCEKKV